MTKRVLVTGGAGFLGAALCQKLLQAGNEVIALDNLMTGRRHNLETLLGQNGFSFIEQDVIEPLDLAVDEIYNLACPASPPHYQKDPVHTFKTSVLGILNLIALARRNHAKLLQSSTSEVYGDPAVHPQVETYWGNVNPIGLRSCYDEGKRGAETLLMDSYRQGELSIKIVRIFNTYGPGMDPADGRVVSNFIMQALQNQPLSIFGDGKQTRSFCYRDDLVQGLIKMMATPDDVTGPVNLGNPGEFTMLELSRLILELTKSQSAIKTCPLPSDDPKVRRPDISKAQALLQWTPTTPLREGLQKTIAYFAGELQRNGQIG